ncbi:hypothetical protein T492DRAFT_864444 [Pavlovales sp. CCMP2436]|nr:hypothetical protein T492DRAFT_864444 [Pavlovales sp. CCMP2436]
MAALRIALRGGCFGPRRAYSSAPTRASALYCPKHLRAALPLRGLLPDSTTGPRVGALSRSASGGVRPGGVPHLRAPLTRALSSGAAADGKTETPPERKVSAFWQTVREHGPVFVGLWATAWVTCLVPIYGVLHFHLVPYDGMDVLHTIGAHYYFDLTKWSPQLVNLVVAVECNEFIDLMRLPAIIAVTPRLARWLRPK